jgi:outer membrane protein
MRTTSRITRLSIPVFSALLFAWASLPSPAQNVPDAPNPQSASSTPIPLTRPAAEQLALRNNPNVSSARLIALAQAQITREVRSAELPTAVANITAADAHKGTLITAGSLTNSSVYTRASGGIAIAQLITDFGRTHQLILSARSSAQSQGDTERATEQDILLAVDQAFYQALISQAVFKVAQETVSQRKDTVDQVSALTSNKLRSDLDLSFANVQLSQAKLLLLDAQNRMQDTMADLDAVLGSESNQQYTLVDDDSAPEPAPQDAEALLQTAFASRPDLAALNDAWLSARQFSNAERDLSLPTVSAIAAGGGTPIRADQITSPWYGAAGVNMQIPIFNGFLFNARAQEAKLRANASQQQVRSLRDTIARDVRTSVLDAQSLFQRIAVTDQILKESNMALDLAQTRYKLGLSGIVEISQAQLSQTQAQIDNANALYAYRIAQAVIRYQTGQ